LIAGFALAFTAADPAPLIRVEPASGAPRPITTAPERILDAEARAFWERTWERLDKADRATRRAVSWRRRISGLSDAAAERRITSLSRSDEDDLFRTRLLVWHLDRLRSRREDPLEPPPAGFTWLPSEAWFGARALRPGPARCEAVLGSLANAVPADRPVRLSTAESQLLEELCAGNSGGAADLAARIDALEPTTARAVRAAWTGAQAGRQEAVASTLAARLAASDPADEPRLRLALARVALARDDELGARAQLGAALAGGDPGAAALTARLAFDRAEAHRARVLLRGWLEGPGAGGEVSALWALAALESAPYPVRPGPETGPVVPVR